MQGYLIVHEGNKLLKSETLEESIMGEVARGAAEVIRLGDGKFFLEGDWYDVPEWQDA